MNFKSHFKYNKQERSGIFFLLFIILVLQVAYFIFCHFSSNEAKITFFLDAEMQSKIDAMKEEVIRKDTAKKYPFNPNFITDYRGYFLGMSVEEINRLHDFRASNLYVSSSEEFQKVTQVSDSLLNEISPYFKFPNRIKKRVRTISPPQKGLGEEVLDLNSVTAEQLKSIQGIGEKLSARIIKFRNRLGGFLVNEQLYDVYGVEPEVAGRVLKQFKVQEAPLVKKININSASAEELQKLIYIQKNVANDIINYRNVKNSIISFDELTKIESFPIDKIDRIILYLSL